MKKKPHQKQSVIQSEFSEFRKRLYNPKNPSNGIEYEVQKDKKGYRVIIHRERGANETLEFKDEASLKAYLAAL